MDANNTPKNTLRDFDLANYSSIRSEYIQIFASFRTLAAAQLAGIALVGKEIISNGTALSTLSPLCIVFCLLVILANTIGHSWFTQAAYQASYIFVAYELPSSIETNNRRDLWILANRAKSNATAKIRGMEGYIAGQELSIFHVLQVISALFVLAVFLMRLWQRKILFLGTEVIPYGVLAVSETALIFFILLLLDKRYNNFILLLLTLVVLNGVFCCINYCLSENFVCVRLPNSSNLLTSIITSTSSFILFTCVLACIFAYRSSNLITKITQHWIDYLKNRDVNDKKYIESFDGKRSEENVSVQQEGVSMKNYIKTRKRHRTVRHLMKDTSSAESKATEESKNTPKYVCHRFSISSFGQKMLKTILHVSHKE